MPHMEPGGQSHFYPRSPCGERLQYCIDMAEGTGISIHALLAESDAMASIYFHGIFYFYPRSPCGERRPRGVPGDLERNISIHALLAESDLVSWHRDGRRRQYFYPRSPCGERRMSTTAETPKPNFYPRSPCGERHHNLHCVFLTFPFLSTLSLRRATVMGCSMAFHPSNFYPRSPCGERPSFPCSGEGDFLISIHALLAESDNLRVVDGSKSSIISIHALLAESDSKSAQNSGALLRI